MPVILPRGSIVGIIPTFFYLLKKAIRQSLTRISRQPLTCISRRISRAKTNRPFLPKTNLLLRQLASNGYDFIILPSSFKETLPLIVFDRLITINLHLSIPKRFFLEEKRLIQTPFTNIDQWKFWYLYVRIRRAVIESPSAGISQNTPPTLRPQRYHDVTIQVNIHPSAIID